MNPERVSLGGVEGPSGSEFPISSEEIKKAEAPKYLEDMEEEIIEDAGRRAKEAKKERDNKMDN